ncbi:NADP-dependent oxidoreductase [Actinomycetospora termitidis]|uniref:NADP-dependent oxidoreductase n=1 Tax=Actinomycetospora termitidis TaxID=3053470 RepID=A0ABT7MHZ4_9PSEU|nr:NADP-dependent oxidoreductase [Actinomycetospora sp. Odt1-22]MDL5160297.1 NADP-dependent oxidoreductase [Actinomycetospora sp. Odt1-22]
MTSRAVQFSRFGGPEVLELVERENPQPGPGQVRVAVRAASVNPADWKVRSGAFARTDAPDHPVVPGFDVAGVVEAVGSGVTTPGVGDEVLGGASGGAYAEKAVADASAVVAKPASMSWEVAGSLGVIVSTTYRVLALLDLRPGATLVVHGASGGVGMIAAQVAASRGVTVIGTASGSHQDDVRSLGVTPVVYGEGLVERVHAITDHVDAVFDTSGKGSLADLVEIAGSADRVITIAHPDAGEHGVRFSGGGTGDPEIEGALAEAAGKIAAGFWRAPAVTTYPLEQAAQAQEDNRTGAVSGKLVLTP